jgi:hypothetical protein
MSYIKVGKASFLKSELTDKKLEEAQKTFKQFDARIVEKAWKEANQRPRRQVEEKTK